MSEDDSEKTEEPTQRRLDDARKKGQVANSKEVSNFFVIMTFTVLVSMFMPWMLNAAKTSLSKYLSASNEFDVTKSGFMRIGVLMIHDFAAILGVPLLLFMVAGLAASVLQNGFHISFESITPKLEKISPLKGFKRMFSMRSFMEFIKGLIKITIVGCVAYSAVSHEILKLEKTPSMGSDELMEYIGDLVLTILTNCCVAIFFIAILDFMYQKFEHLKQLRMSKQEIKEEYKQQEGDPHIKGKLKQMRMQRARQRMMTAVPTADVIVTNPTHFAVAMKYDTAKGRAPIVVALGVDAVAERIKQLANDNDVPIVRNAVLARALYDECELDQEIPFHHYQAVAEVISYVYKLKGKRT